MRFCRKVDDPIKIILCKKLFDEGRVGDVAMNELLMGLGGNVFEFCRVSGIGQGIEIDELGIWISVDHPAN